MGTFRSSEPELLDQFKNMTFVVDVSAWVHKMDKVHEVQYARMSTPVYPHSAIKYSFAAKYRALTELGIKIIPCLIELALVNDFLKRQRAQSEMSSKRKADMFLS